MRGARPSVRRYTRRDVAACVGQVPSLRRQLPVRKRRPFSSTFRASSPAEKHRTITAIPSDRRPYVPTRREDWGCCIDASQRIPVGRNSGRCSVIRPRGSHLIGGSPRGYPPYSNISFDTNVRSRADCCRWLAAPRDPRSASVLPFACGCTTGSFQRLCEASHISVFLPFPVTNPRRRVEQRQAFDR